MEKLPSPQVEKPKRGLGKGPLVPSPAQVLTRDKAAAAATEEERKRKEKIAVEESHDFIRLKQEEEHAKFLVRQAADKQEEKGEAGRQEGEAAGAAAGTAGTAERGGGRQPCVCGGRGRGVADPPCRSSGVLGAASLTPPCVVAGPSSHSPLRLIFRP